MHEPKLLFNDREFIEDYINKIPTKTLEEFTLNYIKNQRSYFKSMHICKDFIRNQLSVSYHSQAYNKIYRKLIGKFARIISKLSISPNLQSLGKGLYRKIF